MASDPKVILVTGASRGIGYAISQYILHNTPHNLILTSRTKEPLLDLQNSSSSSTTTTTTTSASSRIEILTGDIIDPEISSQAVKLAIDKFGRLDGLVLNHGALGEVRRVGDSDVDGWRRTFEVNFFGCITLIQHALPHLRKSHGRIVFVSSGAAIEAYSTWGAYGSSKAAINHLALTLKVEEPDITTISIRPGVVDTNMQKEVREVHSEHMDEKDSQKFHDAHAGGKLLRPEQPGNVIAKLVISAGNDLSGKFLNWNDKLLAEYQD